jgi:hypothetical protein
VTKTQQLLIFVCRNGGATMTEMRKFVVELNGFDWGEMREERHYPEGKPPVKKMVRRHRGYWSDRLPKLLKFFTLDGPSKKYLPNYLVGPDGEVMTVDGKFVIDGGRTRDTSKPRKTKRPKSRLP